MKIKELEQNIKKRKILLKKKARAHWIINFIWRIEEKELKRERIRKEKGIENKIRIAKEKKRKEEKKTLKLKNY